MQGHTASDQQFGQIHIMNTDGSGERMLMDSKWGWTPCRLMFQRGGGRVD